MGLEISRQPCVVPRWERVPFNFSMLALLLSGERFSVVHIPKRGNRREQWIGRIGELEREII
jgi:hypothetical protein